MQPNSIPEIELLIAMSTKLDQIIKENDEVIAHIEQFIQERPIWRT